MTNAEMELAALLIIRDHVVMQDGVPTLPISAASAAVRRIIRRVQQEGRKPDPRLARDWPWEDCVATLRGDLRAAGAADWKGALGDDGRPLYTGMRGMLAVPVTIAGDYLPVRLAAGTPVTVDAIYFGGEEWCSIVLDVPDPTGLKRARVLCNVVEG